jgi:hypothetical protein
MYLPFYKGEDGYNYVETFNKYWISQHNLYLSGPKYCSRCRENGVINDIFLLYCEVCSEIIYNNERGHGIKKYYTMNEWRYKLKLPDYLNQYQTNIYRYIHDNRVYENILPKQNKNIYRKEKSIDVNEINHNEINVNINMDGDAERDDDSSIEIDIKDDSEWYYGNEYDYYKR